MNYLDCDVHRFCYFFFVDMYAFVKCMGSLEDLNGENYPKQILTMQLADAK